MTRKLKESFSVHKLVSDLGRPITSDPVADILRYCDERINAFLQKFPTCDTLTELLDVIADQLGTVFEEIHNDADLQSIKQRYLIESRDFAFLSIEQEFSANTFGVTFKRLNCENWEPEYVSVIDCREEKSARAYFTKWHEIAHLLVLTQSDRAIFKRTHSLASLQDAEETLMDQIASRFGFYPPFLHPHLSGVFSFGAVHDLKEKLCPNASYQSALIGFAKNWPNPCLLLRAEMALKKGEEAKKTQQSFFFVDEPKEVLRAVKVTSSDSARECGFRIHKNMRVPQQSIIRRVFEGELHLSEAEECLSWWEDSGKIIFPKTRIQVQAKRAGQGVDVIICPLD